MSDNDIDEMNDEELRAFVIENALYKIKSINHELVSLKHLLEKLPKK